MRSREFLFRYDNLVYGPRLKHVLHYQAGPYFLVANLAYILGKIPAECIGLGFGTELHFAERAMGWPDSNL